jgi:hypothetical protein
MKRALLVFLLANLILSACAPASAPTPTPAPSATPLPAADAGYLFTTGLVAYAVMSMPPESRPAEYRNCPSPAACHGSRVISVQRLSSRPTSRSCDTRLLM